jgi:tryptophanyl-tRNA synthetase
MRVLTGIQPTNLLHIGNYFGALLPAVENQDSNDLLMMVADLHAITVPQDPKTLQENIAYVVAAYLAAGIDPEKTLLFQQSRVPAHAELCWLLQTVTRIGELERMTQFKDKSTNKGQNVSVGLFTYPVLMAADILLYGTEAVPVGEDQKQHLELARDIAERFNRDFGQIFTVPKPLIRKVGARIRGLDNPEKKMSKSASSPKNYISLMDTADVIRKKIKSAVTDSEATISYDESRLGVQNLLDILSLLDGRTPSVLAATYEGKGMKDLKEDVAEALISHLTPLQEKITGYLENREELEQIITAGSEKANAVASEKIKEVKKIMGLTLAK